MMKKGVVCIVFLLLMAPIVLGDVVINEIMYNPSGPDESHEWIEIYNNGPSDQDLTGWTFYEAATNHALTVSQGDILLPEGEYAIIADNALQFLLDYPGFLGIVLDSSWGSLDNGGETIGIRDDLGAIVDTDVTYADSWGGDETSDNRSIEKKDDTGDNSAANWMEGNPSGSPGRINNVAPTFTSTPITSINENTLYSYSITTSDLDGDIVTLTAPMRAVFSFTDNEDGTGTLTGTITDDADVEPHAITLEVSDGIAPAIQQSFTITVNNVNDAPVANEDSYSINEDTSLVIAAANDLLVNDTDSDTGDSLIAELATDPSNGVATINSDGSFSYTPNQDFFGTDSFTYRATDESGASDTATVTITVSAINDNPMIATIPDQTFIEDSPVDRVIDVTDVDDDESTLTLSLTGISQPIFSFISGVWHLLWNSPLNSDVGQVNGVTITARDTSLASATSNPFGVTITNTNDAPTASDITENTNEDTEITLTINKGDEYTDIDSGDVATSLTVSNIQGATITTSASCSAGICTVGITPTQDSTTTITANYVVNDGDANSNTASITITVTPINDQPVISTVLIDDVDVTADASATVTEGVIFRVEVRATDVDTLETNLMIDLDASMIDTFSLTSLGAELDPDNDMAFEMLLPARDALLNLSLVVNDTDLTTPELSQPKPIELYVQPALDFQNVMINGVENEGEEFSVDVGQEITISFSMVNNFDDTLDHVRFTAEVTGGSNFARIIYENNGSWAMLPEDEREESFTFMIPIDIDVNDFTLTLELLENSGDYGMFEDIFFTIDRKEHAAVISGLNTNTPNLSCSNIAILNLNLTNTGQSEITPEVLIYDRAKDSATFNRTTGEFSSSAGKLYEAELPAIPSLDTSKETFNIDVSSLAPGTKTFYVYIVSPFFLDEFFVGDSGQVSVNVADCVANFFPSTSSIMLREAQQQRFNLNLSEPTTDIHWYLNGTEQLDFVGLQEYPFTANRVGQHTILVTAPDQNKTWTVTASNVPTLGQFTANIPAGVTLSQLASFDLELENSLGKISFDSLVDLRLITNFSMVTIGSDFVFINTSTAPTLNRQAIITLKRTFNNPTILYDASYNPNTLQTCTAAGVSCTSLGNADGQYSFTVQGFSTYKVLETTDPNLVISDIVIDETPRGRTATEKITLTNPGTLQDLTSMQYRFVNVDAKYAASLTGLPSTLEHGKSAEIQLSISIPETETMDQHAIGTLEISAHNGTETISSNKTIFLKPKQFLLVNTIEVNGKSSGDLSVDDTNKIEVEVENDYSEDLEDVLVTVRILDVDGDDLEEEADEFDLDAGDKETVSVEFDLSREDLDEETYTIEVLVEGTATDDSDHESSETIAADLDIEKHHVVIDNVHLAADHLQCTRIVPLDVDIKNMGKEDEENIDVKVSNSALQLSLEEKDLEVDSFFDRDNTDRASFTLDLEDAPEGEYDLTIEVFLDGNKEDAKKVNITIEDCLASSTTSQNINLAGKNAAQQQKATASSSADKDQPITISFRDTAKYTMLIGFLVVLLLFAVILGLAILIKKK